MKLGCPLFLLSVSLMSSPGSAQTVVEDPAPPVKIERVFVWKREFAEFPRTGSGPVNRINQVEPFSKGNGWLGVNDLNGPFYVVNYQGTVREYVDLRDVFPDFVSSPGAGTGFTSFAAHPEFDENGIFYTSHTDRGGSGNPTLALPGAVNEALQGVITEWTASDPAAPVFEGTRREILRIDLTGTIHGFQEIAFRPDIPETHPDYGLLFICIGEAQTLQRGPLSNIGTIESPMGTLFRIDPMGSGSVNGEYGIPADNPFVGVPAAVEEILAYGFRNPHRIAWDNQNDHLILTDIGERQVEEINLIQPGGNYGWPDREGPYLLDPDGNTDVVYELPPDDTGYSYPVAMYDHDEGYAIAGGFVYRGERIPGLTGMFLASDIRTGSLYMLEADSLEAGTLSPLKRWFLRDENGIVDPLAMVGSSSRTDLRIGRDHFGEIYVLTKRDGVVRKLIHESEPQSGYGIFEGYPWIQRWIDTGSFIGFVEVSKYPWTWVDRLGKYVYAAPSEAPSGWIYFPRL